jgi:hypothetical protein
VELATKGVRIFEFDELGFWNEAKFDLNLNSDFRVQIHTNFASGNSFTNIRRWDSNIRKKSVKYLV